MIYFLLFDSLFARTAILSDVGVCWQTIKQSDSGHPVDCYTNIGLSEQYTIEAQTPFPLSNNIVLYVSNFMSINTGMETSH